MYIYIYIYLTATGEKNKGHKDKGQLHSANVFLAVCKWRFVSCICFDFSSIF